MRFRLGTTRKRDTYWTDLIAEVPPKHARKGLCGAMVEVAPLGIPKVYINLDKPGNHACGYCGLRFFRDEHH
nr:unnamed protein product [Callosobruchus chinensis]